MTVPAMAGAALVVTVATTIAVAGVGAPRAPLPPPAARRPVLEPSWSAGPEPAQLARRVLWERDVSLPGGGLLSGLSADLDGDGLHELLLHSGRRNERSCAVALSGGAGEELWRAAFPGRSCLVAADLTGDGADEVVVACGEKLSVLDGSTGGLVRETSLRGVIGDLVSARVGARPEGGNVGDPGADIVYTAGKKRDDVLVVLSGDDLHEMWSREATPADGPFARGFTYPSAHDVDGDGLDEIVVAENGNHLLCLSGAGALAWDVGLGRRERLNPEGVVSATPVVADLFGDGLLELAVGCYAGAVVLMDARTGEVLDRLQFGVEAHEPHLSNSRIPRFIREALRRTGEPVNCLTAVELDGGPGDELVLGCSDGFLYAVDPGSADVMWRYDTLESVYDPCLLVRGGDSLPGVENHPRSEGPRIVTNDLLAWDTEGVYLLAGESGLALAGLGDVAGAAGFIVCDLAGSSAPELVRVAPAGGRVTAWSLGSSP